MLGRVSLSSLAVAFLAAGTIAVLAQAAAPAVYTAEQATAGGDLYRSQCAACHGDALDGTAAPALTGQGFADMVAAQGLTAQSLLTVTAQTMPQAEPATLTPEQYAAITAYVLQKNGYPAGSELLSADNPHLKEINFGKPPAQ
jgi:mono/diheme cytochrome c family protein